MIGNFLLTSNGYGNCILCRCCKEIQLVLTSAALGKRQNHTNGCTRLLLVHVSDASTNEKQVPIIFEYRVSPVSLTEKSRDFWSRFKSRFDGREISSFWPPVSLTAPISDQVSETGLALVPVQLMVPNIDHNVVKFH